MSKFFSCRFLCILVLCSFALLIGWMVFYILEHPDSRIVFCSAVSQFCSWVALIWNRLVKKTDDKTQNPEKKCFEELVKEMKALSNAIQKLAAQANAPGRTHLVEEQDLRLWASISSKQQNANGMNIDLYSVKSSSPPTTVEPSVAPHSKSYMEVSFISYDRLVADPPDAFDELQRITKISESGGVQDVNSNGQLSESEGVVNSSLGRLGLITSAI